MRPFPGFPEKNMNSANENNMLKQIIINTKYTANMQKQQKIIDHAQHSTSFESLRAEGDH